MFSFAREQIERVGNEMQHRFQRLLGSYGIARQIQDERCTQGTAHTSRQGSELRVLRSLRPHEFGNAVDNAVAHAPRSLRGYVARRNACSAGSNHKACLLYRIAQACGDLERIVRQDSREYNLEAGFLKTAL